MNALVIQPAFIGDAIISSALAEALRTVVPAASITYLVRPESVRLLTYAPSIDTVIAFDKYGTESGLRGIEKKASELSAKGFDIIFCLHSSKRSLELVKRIVAPTKVGYEDDGFTHLVRTEPGDDAPMKAVRMVQALYPEVNIKTLPRLEMPEQLVPSSLKQLPHPLVGIAPGSIWKTKRWPAERFVELAQRLLDQGKSVVLIGLERDADIAIFRFGNLLINNKISYLSKLSLEETAAVVSKLDLLISNDSAPVHIATATGTRVISLFGPTVREFGFAPRKSGGEIIEVPELWCRPCSSHGANECPIHTHECMTGISMEMVFEAAVA